MERHLRQLHSASAWRIRWVTRTVVMNCFGICLFFLWQSWRRPPRRRDSRSDLSDWLSRFRFYKPAEIIPRCHQVWFIVGSWLLCLRGLTVSKHDIWMKRFSGSGGQSPMVSIGRGLTVKSLFTERREALGGILEAYRTHEAVDYHTQSPHLKPKVNICRFVFFYFSSVACRYRYYLARKVDVSLSCEERRKTGNTEECSRCVWLKWAVVRRLLAYFWQNLFWKNFFTRDEIFETVSLVLVEIAKVVQAGSWLQEESLRTFLFLTACPHDSGSGNVILSSL